MHSINIMRNIISKTFSTSTDSQHLFCFQCELAIKTGLLLVQRHVFEMVFS